VNVATKADHVAKAKFREKGEQLLITEAAISEYGDAAVGESRAPRLIGTPRKRSISA